MKKVIWLCLLVSSIIACNTADDITLEAGETFTNTNINVLHIDTMTVDFASFKFDSIQFPTGGRILLGNYNDPLFGKTSASTFLEMTPETYSVNSEGVYDSIVLIMKYDNYYYNDTLTNITFNVHEVTKRIKPDDGDYFYNTSTLPYNSTALGSVTFAPEPLKGDSLRINLDYTLGETIFNLIQDNDVNNIDLFRENFKGFTIQPEDADNGSILGFSVATDETMVRIYYNVPEDISDDEQYLDLVINSTSTPQTYFNHVSADRSGTALEGFEDQTETYDSDELNNYSYMQAGVGIGNKITIPYINTLYETGDNGTVLDATLKLYVNNSNYSDYLFLNETLNVYVLDRHQDLVQALTDYNGDAVLATINYDNEFSQTYYTIPVTSFVDDLIASTTKQDLTLILLPDDYETTVNRTVFNNENVDNYEAELEITYALYEDE